MAGFTERMWRAIDAELGRNPSRYGKPVRRSGSVVIGSFNALKLGKSNESSKRWNFLKKIVSRFDLIAVQEVLDDLSGIRRLQESLGPDFKLVVSDTTGAFPGDRGLRERLAYIYRPSRIQLGELVSDITYDRSKIVSTLREDIGAWTGFFTDIDRENAARSRSGKRPKSLSSFSHPAFSTFIRTPHCASFSILPKGNADPIEFLAVNAHLLYGKDKLERIREFRALMGWLIRRAKSRERMYARNMILLGDLNLEFESAGIQLSDITMDLFRLNSTFLTGSSASRANFPFLDVHPDQSSLFSTNARKSQTFDHIAFFIDRKEKGLPPSTENGSAGHSGANGYDYGVFDFVELFAEAVHGKPLSSLTAAEKKKLYSRALADVSDHMPIWARIPIPGA